MRGFFNPIFLGEFPFLAKLRNCAHYIIFCNDNLSIKILARNHLATACTESTLEVQNGATECSTSRYSLAHYF